MFLINFSFDKHTSPIFEGCNAYIKDVDPLKYYKTPSWISTLFDGSDPHIHLELLYINLYVLTILPFKNRFILYSYV